MTKAIGTLFCTSIGREVASATKKVPYFIIYLINNNNYY